MISPYSVKFRSTDTDIQSLAQRRILECLADAESCGYLYVEMKFVIEYLSDVCSSEHINWCVRLMQERGLLDAVITSQDGRPGQVKLVCYPGTLSASVDGILIDGSVVLCS